MTTLKLDPADVKDLDVFANPSDLRQDLHALVDYVRTHDIKRGHRDNQIPKSHRQRLARQMSDPTGAAKTDADGGSPWIEHLDWATHALKIVSYDTEGSYAGYSSAEPSFPDNYVQFEESQYNRFLELPLQGQEDRILKTHLDGSSRGDSEFFSPDALSRLDRFNSWGCATGVVPTIRFPQIRRRLLELLSQCPAGVWFSTASLIEHLRLHEPWFLIPKEIPASAQRDTTQKGRYGNFAEGKRGDWANRDRISDKDPESFAKVEGRYIERFLEAIPLVLGYTEVAYVRQKNKSAIEPSRGLLRAFRVTERLIRALRKEITVPKVTLLPNFEVHVESLFFPAKIEAELRPLGDLVQRGITTVFKLTKPKTTAALADHPEKSPIETLQALCGRSLPVNVEQELNEWARHSDKFVLYEGFGLLEGHQESARADRFVVEAISPNFALVRSAEKLYHHLEKAELVPVRIRHSEKALAAPHPIQSRLASKSPPSSAPIKREVKVKRSIRTTLLFTDAKAHAAFCEILLDSRCVVPVVNRSALTVSYPRKAEALVKECLKKFKQEHALAVEDIET